MRKLITLMILISSLLSISLLSVGCVSDKEGSKIMARVMKPVSYIVTGECGPQGIKKGYCKVYQDSLNRVIDRD